VGFPLLAALEVSSAPPLLLLLLLLLLLFGEVPLLARF